MTTTDEDGLNGSPWWLKAFIRVGLPTAFASVLLWFLMSNITGVLSSLQQADVTTAMTQATIVENQKRIIELLVQHEQDQRMAAQVLSVMCYNGARTDADRTRCVTALTARPQFIVGP